MYEIRRYMYDVKNIPHMCNEFYFRIHVGCFRTNGIARSLFEET